MLKAIIGLDHLPQNDVNWSTWAPYGMVRTSNLAAANQSIIQNGWACAANAVSGQEYTVLDLTRWLAAPVSKVTVGIRFRFTTWANASSLILQASGAVVIPVLTDAQLVAAIGTPPAGSVMYFEVAFNMSGVVQRRINGVPLADTSTNAQQRNIQLQIWNKASTGNRIDWRDIYVVDDQGGPDQPTGFLGSVMTTPASLTVTEATDYVTFPAGGSVQTAVYSPGSIPADLVAQSPASRSPLKVRLNTTLPADLEVFGIDMGLSARSDATGHTTISSKITKDGTDLVGGNVAAPPNGYNYTLSPGVFARAPDGSKWTPDSINGAIFTLQPEA